MIRIIHQIILTKQYTYFSNRHNLVSFYQLSFCHALILLMHTVNLFFDVWRNHWLSVVMMDILVENILVPTFWFYSGKMIKQGQNVL